MGKTTAFTLKANEFVAITDIALAVPAGGPYVVAANTDADGQRIIKGTASVAAWIDRHYETPYLCPMGVVPTLIASEAADCVMTGYLCQN
jgi:hypothetical protein